MSKSLAVTAPSIARTIELAHERGETSAAVAWGVQGASPDGYTILAIDDQAAAERLSRNIRFARSRINGKPGHWLVWGLCDDVHTTVYAEADRVRSLYQLSL